MNYFPMESFLIDGEKKISNHWLIKEDRAILFLLVEGTAAFINGVPTTDTQRVLIAAYKKYDDGYAYTGPRTMHIRNLNILTGLSGRWDLELARGAWKAFLADGWTPLEKNESVNASVNA